MADVGTAQIAHAQVALNSSTATLVAALRPSRRRVLIQNTHASDIAWIGVVGVTASTGIRVSPGLTLELYTRAALYGISAANAPSVAVVEEY